jgi:hypothetical protein
MFSAHLILGSMTVTIFGEAYRLWTASFCSLTHPPS